MSKAITDILEREGRREEDGASMYKMSAPDFRKFLQNRDTAIEEDMPVNHEVI
jgi:hypothetical protein